MRKTTFLATLILSVSLLLVACSAPPTPTPNPNEVPEVSESAPTGESQATEETEAPETSEALTESETSAEPETPVDPPAPEPQAELNVTQFEPGQCQVTLTTETPALRATDESLVAGTLPAGVYGVLQLVQTEAQGDFLAIPLADGREVFVALSAEADVVADETCGLPTQATATETEGTEPNPELEMESEATDTDTDTAQLTGVTWQWVQTITPLDALTVPNPEAFTIQFNDDGTANITADCNVVGAIYEVEGSSISITLGPSTMAFCGEEALDQQFLAQLSTAVIFFFQDDDLYMDMPMDSGTMQFTAVGEPTADESSLVGPLWAWQQLVTPADDAPLIIPTPENYTIRFNEDGTVNITADCNVIGGTYTQDGSALTITLGASSMAACSPESLDTTYLESLSSVALYFRQDGALYFDLIFDSGTLRFEPLSE